MVRSLPLMAIALAACGGTSGPPASTAEATPRSSGAEAEMAAAGTSDATDPEPAEGAETTTPNEFRVASAEEAKTAHGEHASKIKPTEKEAAVRLFVTDKDKGAVPGVVVELMGPGGTKFVADETDAEGYAELLVPNGQTYDIVFLSLGRTDIASKIEVPNEPTLRLNLTVRYKRWDPPANTQAKRGASGAPRFVLTGVEFETGKATLRKESYPKLDSVLDYMTHKRSARVEISGHTDNVGNPKANKTLSQKRADAVKHYLVSKGIDGARIEAVGYGDALPIAPNETEEGRQKNRRIEATEL